MAQRADLTRALIDARAAESARLDALFAVADLRSLRLEHLRDLLRGDLASRNDMKPFFGLNIEAGEAPRLWLDLVSSIVMEPDPKTYRLVEMQGDRRETLFDTQDANDMRQFALRYVADRKVAREASAAKSLAQLSAERRDRLWIMGLVWLGGALFGAVCTMAWFLHAGLLGFDAN